MNTSNNNSLKEKYIKDVLKQVHFKWEHDVIAKELCAHMEDSIEWLEMEGVEQKEAEAQAVKLMGDAVELGKALDKEHKSWIGRLQLLTNVVVVALLIIMIPLLLSGGNLKQYLPGYIDDAIKYSMEGDIHIDSLEGQTKVAEIGESFILGKDTYTFSDAYCTYNENGPTEFGIYIKVKNSDFHYVNNNSILYTTDGTLSAMEMPVGLNVYDGDGKSLLRTVRNVVTEHRGSGAYLLHVYLDSHMYEMYEDKINTDSVRLVYDGFGEHFEFDVPLSIFKEGGGL